MEIFKFLGLTILLQILKSNGEPCVERFFGYSSFVCVCNATFCNFDGPTTPLNPGQVRVVTSSRDQYRNHEQILDLPPLGSINYSDVNASIFLDSSHEYQTMKGFGGAFTDAASINIKLLSDEAQENLLRMYFAEEGNRYNLVRVPIAGCDFSVRPYSYDDVEGDVDLQFFNLTAEDYDYKLPLIRRAIELCPDDFYIFGSPWAPPAWMKSNGVVSGPGDLLKEYWQPYSNYLVKFIEAYEAELGVQLWGLTPQNEPLGGYENWLGNGCGWTAEAMREWIADYLGPTLEAAGYRRLVFMVDDYNRYTLPWYNIPMLTDSNSSKYIDGIAVHWYDDTFIGPEGLDETHELAPDKFILMTEACEGPGEIPHVQLGSWERGEHYLTDIIENNNHWSTGWVDWNLALDVDGGPNWAHNFADAPIIVSAEFDEFFLEPMYYAMSLFGRHVPRGSIKIYHTIVDDDADALRVNAFLSSNGNRVIIIGNVLEEDLEVGFTDQSTDYIFKTSIGAKSWSAIEF